MLMNQHASDNGSLDDWNAQFSFTHTRTHAQSHQNTLNRAIFVLISSCLVIFSSSEGLFHDCLSEPLTQTRMTQHAYIFIISSMYSSGLFNRLYEQVCQPSSRDFQCIQYKSQWDCLMHTQFQENFIFREFHGLR